MSQALISEPITTEVPIVRVPKEVIPAWVKDRQTVATRVGDTLNIAANEGLFHLARSPWYWLKIARYSFSGISNVAGPISAFVRDHKGLERMERLHQQMQISHEALQVHGETTKENRRLKRQAHKQYSTDAREYARAEKRHIFAAKWRTRFALINCVGTIGVDAYGATFVPLKADIAIGMSLLTVAGIGFGIAGKPREVQILKVNTKSKRLTAPKIMEVLKRLGIADLTKHMHEVETISDVQKLPNREGYEVTVQLPVPARDVMNKHEKFATLLNVSRSMLTLENDATGPASHLKITVSNKDISQRKQGEWPGLKTKSVDIFRDAIPFGEDSNGKLVSVSLEETNIAIAGMTRRGKSKALKNIMAFISLDPRTRLWPIDLSGKGGFKQFSDSPIYVNDAEHGPSSSLRVLEILDEELKKRKGIIDNFSVAECPENKVTPELANHPDLYPLVLVIEEIHNLCADPEHMVEGNRLLDKIARDCIALGVRLIITTQRPSARAIPRDVLSQFGTQIGFKVREDSTSRMLFGETSDIDISRLPDIPGVCIVNGQHESPQQVRTFNTSAEQLQTVIDRGLKARGVVQKINLSPKVATLPVDETKPVKSKKFPHLLQDIVEMERPEDGGQLQCIEITERLPKRPEYDFFGIKVINTPIKGRARYEGYDYNVLASELRKMLANGLLRPQINKSHNGGGNGTGVHINDIKPLINKGETA